MRGKWTGLFVLVSACGSPQVSESQPAASAADVEVVGQLDGAPAGCTSGEIVLRIVALLTDMSGDEVDVTQRYFGTGDDPFTWFSMTETRERTGTAVDAYSRDSLRSYFERRPFENETLRLTKVRFIGWSSESGNVGISPFAFEVSDSSGLISGYGYGKAEYHCESGSFQVISMGIRTKPDPSMFGPQ